MSEASAEQSTATEATDAESVEADGQVETTDESHESEDDRDDVTWDAEKAKRTIAKIASEKKALRERATKAEEKAASAEEVAKENGGLKATVLQLEVGYELGLPLAIAKRLQGSTREEMVADAEALVDLVAPAKKSASRKPTEALRGGLKPDEEPEETDTRKIAERMFRS